MIYKKFSSSLGMIVLSTGGVGISGVYFEGQRHFEAIPEEWIEQANNKLLLLAEKQIKEYLARKRKAFDLPFAINCTEFEKKVWQELLQIPHGQTKTYSEIAQKIGQPKASRAVGMAIGRNKLSIVIPCHRVIGKSGELTGYSGGIDRKKKLLRLESDFI